MERLTLYTDVILPVPVPNLYTYRVPSELNDEAMPGKRVVVKFGKSKHVTGIIRHVHETPPKVYQAKYLDAILDPFPIVDAQQFKLWEWMAGYYLCTIGEVMNAALPAGLKLDADQYIVQHPDFDEDYARLSDREYLVAEAVQVQKRVKLSDVPAILGIKTIQPIIKGLIDGNVVMIEEELKARYKPKILPFVSLGEHAPDDSALENIMSDLERTKVGMKQLNTLLAYLQLRPANGNPEVLKKDILKNELASVSSLNTLVKRGVLQIVEREVNRMASDGEGVEKIKALSEDQQRAYDEVKSGFEANKVTLLHGVTSSGKTEIYVGLIREALDRGEQVLYMLPEIALTTQLIGRLKVYFGDQVGVYHSRFSQNERVEVWNRTMTDTADRFNILIGARSSLFLPFTNLGLVIIDEEHENTFKQFDPAPRYQGRDAAIYLSRLHGADTLLGSATPALETYWHAENGRYHLVELNKRYGDVRMPEILCADVKRETREKTMKSHFSSFLLQHIDKALENKEQIILFQNRRGYTPQWVCEDCGWVPQCVRCDVSLTYHKHAHLLNCHYCGYAIHPPRRCEACGSSKLEMKGFGTEKVEDELQQLYPDLRLARMDLDTTRSKHGYQKMIDGFSAGEMDVLIGTQMVSKGLDFGNVSLVGILSADQMLNFPDFRSFERAYQLMSQVSGRAGRKKKRGKVIIQTYNPDHWIIQQVIDGNYKAMYQQELFERKSYSYPPYYRLIRFTLKHRDKDVVRACADHFAGLLTETFKNRVLGPQDPIIARINNLYLKQVLLKLERELSPSKVRETVLNIVDDTKNMKSYKGVRIIVDVDPM